MAAFLTPKRDLAQPDYGCEALDGNLERLSFASILVPEPLVNYRPRRILGGQVHLYPP